MLAEERGLLFDFNNSDQLTAHINDLLENEDKGKRLPGMHSTWPKSVIGP